MLLLFSTVCHATNNVQNFARAIAKAEGSGKKGVIPTRYHNPGDLKAVHGFKYPGQVGIGKGKHVIFQTDQAGWAALIHQINTILAGQSKHYTLDMTLQQVAKKYAGNWQRFAKSLAHNLGVPQDTTLAEYFEIPPVITAPPNQKVLEDILSWQPQEHSASLISPKPAKDQNYCASNSPTR
jgi:hypothetical protein